MPMAHKISREKAAEIKEIRKTIKDKKQIKDQPVEKASKKLAFSNKLWYNILGDEKC